VQRVHGGALPVSPAAADYPTRTAVAVEEKSVVARLAAPLIADGMTVFIDGGTTALALCAELPVSLVATVVTHSPTIAVALMALPSVEVLVVGGRLYRHSVVATGTTAAEQISMYSFDACFLGVTGVDHRAGLTTGDAEEAAIKRTISQRSSDTYVLASSEKLGVASPFTVIPLASATAVITDCNDTSRLQPLLRSGVAVLNPAPIVATRAKSTRRRSSAP
jgi:DeoR/GlpR family transcriptional regulator of sugar metabolism